MFKWLDRFAAVNSAVVTYRNFTGLDLGQACQSAMDDGERRGFYSGDPNDLSFRAWGQYKAEVRHRLAQTSDLRKGD